MLTCEQNVSIKASYEVQSKRSLVERVIRKVNEWKVLDDWQADGVEDFEAWLDFVLAMCNLRQLERLGRLEGIPDEELPGADRRNFSKSVAPPLLAVKVSNKPPPHLQLLLDEGPDFFNRKWEASFRPTPLRRALSRVNSCYILQINCCRLESGAFLIAAEAAASAMGLTYLVGIMVDRSNFFLQHACSCTVGQGSLEDEADDDERPRRGVEEKGGCSHIAAVLELLAQIQEKVDDFDYVIRKAKGPRLDAQFRHAPLATAWEQLLEARRRVYVGKVPLDDRQPLPTCICRKGAEAYKSGTTITCSVCCELYHNGCIGLSKPAAGKLGADWRCGFCVGAGLQGDDDLSGADVHGSADGSGDEGAASQLEQQQTWTIAKMPRKVKGQPKPAQPVATDFHRLFSDTPAYFQRKKKARTVDVQGYADWADLSAAIHLRSEEAMQYMQRLKRAGEDALKKGGHHVADSQGADGLAPVELTAEVLDQLEDAGLLDVDKLPDDCGE